MNFSFKTIFVVAAVALFSLASCEQENDAPVLGISNVKNPYLNKKIPHGGETVSIKFDAPSSWKASLKAFPESDANNKEWVSINENTLSGEAKDAATVRITFKENKASEERQAELWIELENKAPQKIATLRQAVFGSSIDAEMNTELNSFMHEILKEDYLWAEEYNKLAVDLTVPYTDFLGRHLLSMGNVNIEDGGYYRQTHELSGEKYIYTSLIEELPATRAITGGLGFGPFISTSLAENSTNMAIAPSYVRIGSPAERAGLRRGDLIYAVNGTLLTTANYKFYMNSLYKSPFGAYAFSYIRFEKSDDTEVSAYVMKEYESDSVTAGEHLYNPVLFCNIFQNPNDEASKIGYMVYEAFEVGAWDLLQDYVQWLKDNAITDLVLDLRFNVGGDVPLSRWLSGCIAGAENYSKTFCKTIFNDGKTETWTFGNGYETDDEGTPVDQLGTPIDLNLKRVYVIGSYNTASASELLINSLAGIDFDITLIGSRTEGKNVGMNVSRKKYKGRSFAFQPVTFWVRNAKDNGDYADGMLPDENWIVNNDNKDRHDDGDPEFPYSFADWANMDFNLAFQWAWCDITGEERWEVFNPANAAPSEETRSLSPRFRLLPRDVQPFEAPAGRFGNLIRKSDKDM